MLKFQIFLGVPEIPDNFLEWTVDAWPEHTYEEILRVSTRGREPVAVL